MNWPIFSAKTRVSPSENNESVYELEDFSGNMQYGIDQTVFQIDLLSIVAEGFAEIAEYKDKETGYHIKRVAKLTELVALALKSLPEYREVITEEFTDILKVSSKLHDIGKVTIPDAILTKPAKLTIEEFEYMKVHAQAGANILENMHKKISCYQISYFKVASLIAGQHHEKFDGSGYPRGLKGNEIALEAQITSIVDVFDALMSKRPYKPAFSIEKSYEIIAQLSGTHFNPVLVEIFFQEMSQIRHVYALLRDEA